MKCKICDSEIVGKANNAQYCDSCFRLKRINYHKEWYYNKGGREWNSKYMKDYSEERKEEKSQYDKDYRKKNKEHRKELDKIYRQTEEGKLSRKKSHSKRKRNLKFIPFIINPFVPFRSAKSNVPSAPSTEGPPKTT